MAMQSETLLHDPVFQLNLLLWMAKEQPEDDSACVVIPFFHRHGFSWQAVSQPFVFPVGHHNRIDAVRKANGIDIGFEPEPELVLKRDHDRSALYFEAKSNAFTPQSSNCRQARAHLLATGEAFAEVITPLVRATLTYVIPEAGRDTMTDCLEKLSAELIEAKLSVGKHSVAGLRNAAEGIRYVIDDAGMSAIGCTDTEVTVLSGFRGDVDPSPLLLVYSDEDCPSRDGASGEYRKILQQQVLASLLCETRSLASGSAHRIDAAGILGTTTQQAFDFLGRTRQQNMERLILHNVFRPIFNYWKERIPGMVTLKGRAMVLEFGSPDAHQQYFKSLEGKKISFPDSPAAEDLDLFSQVEDRGDLP
jgi:hypothetical protein